MASEGPLPSSPSLSLKRDREEDDDDGLETPLGLSKFQQSTSPTTHSTKSTSLGNEWLTGTADHVKRDSTPDRRSSISSLTEPSPRTPSAMLDSSMNAFAVLNGVAPPPKKKAKLTYQEKEAERLEKKLMKERKEQERLDEKARREQERLDEKARKEQERREKEMEKARREKEREEERRQKEAEREEKRQKKEAEKAEKENIKKAKEDEKLKIEEGKKKKEASQLKLNAFFKAPNTSPISKAGARAMSPASTASSDITNTTSPKKQILSEYERKFPPFFIQTNVTLAPINRFQRDEKALKALERVVDTYINGTQFFERPSEFDACSLFKVPDLNLKVRGRHLLPVKEIMAEILGGPSRPIDLTTDSQNTQIKRTRRLLKSVPYKILKFAEDVRPPYTGTFTSCPMSGIRKLARNPTKRDLPGVDYDYDSEAEWEEPGEDEEDLGSEGDEEEDLDGEEDMDGFLDDAEDELAKGRKLVMKGDLEPKSTGLCWEDDKRRGPALKMYGYLMEIIHDDSKVQTPIDPFATHYWEPAAKAITSMDPPRMPLNAVKVNSVGMNVFNSKPVKMFGAVAITKPVNQTSTATKGPKKLISQEDMPAFKAAVEGSDLSKLGLIEVLNKQFPKLSKAAIKGTLESFARRSGTKEAEKRWIWTDGVTG